jgi:hypothetical protein
MLEFVLTMIGFAGAMTIPVFLTAVVENAASGIRPSPVRANRLRGDTWNSSW